MKKITLLLCSALIILFNACKDTDTPLTKGESIEYTMAITGGTYPNQTTYFMGFENFPTGTVSTAGAAELPSSGIMYAYNGYTYLTTFGAPATLRKYGFDDAGKPKELGSFIVQGLKTFGAIDFISDTEAYAASNGFGGVPKLAKFNPTTMQVTASVDLTSIQKPKATEVYYLGMAHRDNYLFMGVNYQDASFSNLGDSVYVTVINRTTNKVEKLIADGRCGIIWNSGPQYGFGASSLVLDENKDLYIMGTGNGSKVPSGIVRIKNGETTFDQNYFFNLKSTLGSDAQGIFYYGNGKALTLKSEDPDYYPFDNSEKAGYKYYKIDLNARTSQGEVSSSLPQVFSTAFTKKWDNTKLYLSAPTASTNAIYSMNLATGAVTKEFDVAAGECNGFVKIK